jgi:hypothetical protein
MEYGESHHLGEMDAKSGGLYRRFVFSSHPQGPNLESLVSHGAKFGHL